MRRVTGLLTFVLTFHLFVVAGDFACAKHNLPAMTSMAAMPMHSSQSAADHAPPGGEQGHDCHTPVSSDCCTAVTSCTPALLPTTTLASAEPLANQSGAIVGPASSSLSRVTAPETPPPRA